MKKILVTGSAGHLGEALMRHFHVQGQPALGLDILASPFTDAHGSITDAAFVASCMQGVDAVLHTATLHKPHVATHSVQDFIDTNISGTAVLLDAARRAGVKAFVFTSTTSAFGAAMQPATQAAATWVTEELVPVPKNIYGASKCAAEDLCQLFHRQHGLPVLVLRTSRFFPERDDDPERSSMFDPLNLQVIELLYRRVDIEDVVSAHVAALQRAPALGFGRYIISATTPFRPEDTKALRGSATSVLRQRVPAYEAVFAQRGWRMLQELDRVYVNDRARADLHWEPRHSFASALDALSQGLDHRSAVTHQVGIKGYHAGRFADGSYPVV